MEKYRVVTSNKVDEELKKIYKYGRKSDISKIENIFLELEINPREGTRQPEKLKHQELDIWSRRINKKDRLIYEIHEEVVTVIVLSVLGHYKDK